MSDGGRKRGEAAQEAWRHLVPWLMVAALGLVLWAIGAEYLRKGQGVEKLVWRSRDARWLAVGGASSG